MPRTFQPWITYAVIAINAAMCVVASVNGLTWESTEVLIELGGNIPALTCHGEPWRLIASVFLHAGALHLAINMWSLYQLRGAEPRFGRMVYATIYLVSSIAGSLLTLVFAAGNQVTVGAAAGIAGVIGALAAAAVQQRHELPARVNAQVARRLALALGLSLLIGAAVPSASLSGLIGGALAGVALGALLSGAPGSRQRTLRALGAVVVALGLGAAVPALLPVQDDLPGALHLLREVDRGLVARYGEVLKEHHDERLTDAAFATRLDDDLLPAYRAARERLRALGATHPVITTFEAYMTAQLAEWTTRRDALRATDPAVRERLFARAALELAETKRLFLVYAETLGFREAVMF